jgi:hypothetical protein
LSTIETRTSLVSGGRSAMTIRLSQA